MAYSTPKTWVAGEIATAADLNTYVSENVKWLATDSPSASAHRTATQSVADSTDTLVQLNNTSFDNASMHSNVTNNNSHVVPTGGDGKYLITGAWSGSSATGGWFCSVSHNSRTQYTNKLFYAGAYGTTTANGTFVASLAAGDYVACWAAQYSGTAKNIGGVSDMEGTRTPVMSVFWFRN